MKYITQVVILSVSYQICGAEIQSKINFSTPFLLNTKSCQIPNFSPFSPDLNLTRDSYISSCTNYDPLLSYTEIQDGIPRLHLHYEAIIKYFGTSYGIRCCYSYLYRNGSEDWPDVGVVASRCVPFYFPVILQHDLVRVTCSKSDDGLLSLNGFPFRPVYDNIHQLIIVSDNIKFKSKQLPNSDPSRKISVLLVVIDSVSRLNFYRTMPHTKEFIKSRGFYEFIGYNKVADNTFPNAMAFLTGLTLKEAIQICKPEQIDGLNYCPFIWNYYRDYGYVTAYAEDWSQIATFNYQKKGFKHHPTDYYFKPYMDAITYLPTIYQDTMPFCAGPESQGDRILNLAKDFATSFMHVPSFGIFWMNTFSHNYITSPMTMDIRVRNFFEDLEQKGVLNDSVVILLSDHGIRFGEINNTTRGFYELRLPMNFISLPVWFKSEHPKEFSNFVENTRKLTSNFDLHMTLQDILRMSTNYNVTSIKACPRCKSFFEYIPDERGCSDAGIPPIWCTCNVNSTDTLDVN